MVALVLPHLMVVLVSFARDGAWTTQVLPPEYTLENYRRLFSESELWRPITNSVSMAAHRDGRESRRLLSRGVSDRVPAVHRAGDCCELLVAAAVGDSGDGDRARSRGDFQPERPRRRRACCWSGTFWILPLAYFIRDIPLVASAVE